MKNYFYCLIGILVFSCSNASKVASYKIISADSIKEHSAQQIELFGENFGPKKKFGYLLDISFVAGKIVVQDKKKSYAFFSLENESDIIPIQEIGDGPQQVSSSEFIKVVNYDESLDELYFFDYSNRSLSRVKIQSKSTFRKHCEIPDLYWGQMQSAVNLNDSLVAVTGRFSETKFIIFNRNNQTEILRSDYVNSFTDELPEEGRVAAAPVDIKYNIKNELIVVTKPGINSIDTYSIDGGVNKLYSFGDFENISKENLFDPNYFYYYNVKTQGDLVYGLYLGVDRGMIAMQELFLSEVRPELHVFNLLTDELLRFKLDRVINACVIDSGNKIIYCIEEDNEDQPLVKYEIPEIL